MLTCLCLKDMTHSLVQIKFTDKLQATTTTKSDVDIVIFADGAFWLLWNLEISTSYFVHSNLHHITKAVVIVQPR